MSSHQFGPQLGPTQKERKPNLCGKYFGWIRYITVEPSVCLYVVAYHFTVVVHQDFYVNKSCRVEHGLSDEICNNLTANATLNAQVQVTVSNFLQWNNIVGQIAPIILALFHGNWSDRRGRKAPLVIALVGKVINGWMIVVNSLMDTWSLNMIVYTATLPMAILGSDVALVASAYSYIVDISSSEKRTMRISIMDIAYLGCLPLGVALGSYVFYNVVNSSHTMMFAIEGVIRSLALIYSIVRLEMRTTPQQKPLEKGTNLILDYFDKGHVVATVRTLIKPRPARRRQYLWILLLAMALYTFQRAEAQINYLYTQLTFSWNVAAFSQFRTVQSGVYVPALLCGIPILRNFLGMRDTLIAIVGTLSFGSGRIFFALTEIPELFYVGAVVSALGPITLPMIRSMSSKVVPIVERGKVFAILSVCENAAIMISTPLYSQLYNATLTTAPSSIYWFTIATQIVILLLIMVIHVTLGSHQLDAENEEDVDLCSPKLTRESPVLELEVDKTVPI